MMTTNPIMLSGHTFVKELRNTYMFSVDVHVNTCTLYIIVLDAYTQI